MCLHGSGSLLTRRSLGSRGPAGQRSWLGRQDSNLQMAAPKAAALPFGDAPSDRECREDVTLAGESASFRPYSGPSGRSAGDISAASMAQPTELVSTAQTRAADGSASRLRASPRSRSLLEDAVTTVAPLPDIPTPAAPRPRRAALRSACDLGTQAGRDGFEVVVEEPPQPQTPPDAPPDLAQGADARGLVSTPSNSRQGVVGSG